MTDGNTHKACLRLLRKYETRKEDVQSLEEDWNRCKLDNLSIDQMEWFLKLDRINRMLKSINVWYGKDNVQIAGHILNNISKEYGTVVTSIESSGKTGDIEAIQEAVEKHWKKNDAGGLKSRNLGKAFVTEKFQGTCNYCKKPGHKFADCWKRQANLKKKRNNGEDDGSKKTVKCWICGAHILKRTSKIQGQEEQLK